MKTFGKSLFVLGLLASVLLLGSANADTATWTSTWITTPQPPMPGSVDRYRAQTLRLVVHASVGGSQVRIRLSNLYGNTPLTIGAAHIARRTDGADIDPAYDRALTFDGRTSVVVPAHATVLSDPTRLEVPALTDLSVSLYLLKGATATTGHILALQTSYVSRPGNATAATHFPIARRIDTWPFLTSVDVTATPQAYAVVVFGDSTVDGDGSTEDANQRWSDALAVRLQHTGRNVAVLNAGLIGNRLLLGSPGNKRYGAALGEAGVARFSRDALDQVGTKVVIVRIGSNDIGFPGALTSASESIDADNLIAGYRRLIELAHQRGTSIVGTTIPPFEKAGISGYFTPAKEAIRQQVNAWIRDGGQFDAVLDADRILRDPSHPTRVLPAYDSGDHLHPNDAGYRALASALPLETLDKLASGAMLPPTANANGMK
jgi:lysophospholipase L1-like esterase